MEHVFITLLVGEVKYAQLGESAGAVWERINGDGGHGGKPMHHGYRTKIREILQNAYFVIPKPEAFQEGLSTVNQILQELETGGYARGQDFVEAKSAAVCAKIILSEVLNENDA